MICAAWAFRQDTRLQRQRARCPSACRLGVKVTNSCEAEPIPPFCCIGAKHRPGETSVSSPGATQRTRLEELPVAVETPAQRTDAVPGTGSLAAPIQTRSADTGRQWVIIMCRNFKSRRVMRSASDVAPDTSRSAALLLLARCRVILGETGSRGAIRRSLRSPPHGIGAAID